MTHSFPLAGRADGGKRKEPHDGKKSSHTDTTETRADFCVHAALGRLRFVSGSTAQLTLFGCFQYIRNRRSSQDLRRKKCSCPCKIFGGAGAGLGFERTASTASVCTLAEKRCLPYRSDLLISKHIRCGHTPEKWLSWLSAEAPFFYFGIVPNPLLSGKNSLPT